MDNSGGHGMRAAQPRGRVGEVLWVGQHVTPRHPQGCGEPEAEETPPKETEDKILSLERGTGSSFKAKM